MDIHSNDSSIATKLSQLNNTNTTTSVTLNTNPLSGSDTNYCNACDIKFNYLNTFIAHKKFYCKNIQSDFDGTSATTNQTSAVLSTARSSPNQTSVVT